jgi:hypothetical protein
MAALVAEGYPVPVDLLVQLVHVMQCQLTVRDFVQRSPWRPAGAPDADEGLLNGMAALPLAALLPVPAPGTVTDASVVPLVRGWRVCALSHQALSLRAVPAQRAQLQVESAAGITMFRDLCANAASITPHDAEFIAVWHAIEPIAAAARRLMSEAGATALLLELAPWDTGKTAWGSALAFFAAAHAFPGALAAALPAMTDAAACLAAHTAIHGSPHLPCAQEGGVLMDLPKSAQANGSEVKRCTGDAQPVWGEVPHLVRPALVTLLRHPAAAAAAPAQLATCCHMRARHVLCSLGREHADLQRKALSSYFSPDLCSPARVFSGKRNPPRIEAPTWRCLAAACLVEGAAYTRDHQGGDLDMALFVMDPLRRPPLLLPVYVDYEVKVHAAAQPGAGGSSGPLVRPVTSTLPLLLGEWMAVKLAAGELTAYPTPPLRAHDYHCPASMSPHCSTAGAPTAADRSAANDGTGARGRHTAAVLHCCWPSTLSVARCGLVHRHPTFEPLALQLAAAADAVDERDEAFSASVGWPQFRPPHADLEVTRHSLDTTLGHAALWRLLDSAGVDLGVVSGQPFRYSDSISWPRLGWGGRSDWNSCSPSARLWHRALADCFEAGVGSLLLAASSVLMREIARCIGRHAPALLSEEQAEEPAWPPPPQPGLVGAAAADAFAAAAAAAAACFDLATRHHTAPGPPPGLPRAERKAAVREALERAAALSPAEKAAARRARKEARRTALDAAKIAADETALPFEMAYRRLLETPPPPPRVPFDPQARIAGWEGTVLTRLLTSAVPARWAAQAEMAAVLVEELGCDASAPIAAGAAPHAVPGAAGAPVDAASDYTLMHAAAAVWLTGLGGGAPPPGAGLLWPEIDPVATQEARQSTKVRLQPYQAPTPPPRVAAAALRYIVDRVPALGVALRARRRGLSVGGNPGSPRGRDASQPLPPPAMTRVELPPELEAAGLSPVEAAVAAGPYLAPGRVGLRLIPAVHAILASGDRGAAEHYLGVDLPRLSAALLPRWTDSQLLPAGTVAWFIQCMPSEQPEPAMAAARAVVVHLNSIRDGMHHHKPPPMQAAPPVVAQLGPAPPAMVERWLRLQTQDASLGDASGNGAGDAACLDLTVASQDELRGCLRKAVTAVRAARAAADEANPIQPWNVGYEIGMARATLPQHMSNALALLAEWARRKPGGAAAVAYARAAARGDPPPIAWWPTPPQLVEEGDAEVAAAAAEVAVAGVLHGWPAGDVWLAVGLVGEARQPAWLRHMLAELAGLYAPAVGHPPPLMASVPLITEAPLLALRHPGRLAALRMVLQHPAAAAALDSDTISSLLRLAYTLGPGYARLLVEAGDAAVTPPRLPSSVTALVSLVVECGALGRAPSPFLRLDMAWQRRQHAAAVEQHRRRVLAAAAVMLDQARHTAAGKQGVRALTALRQPVTGRTLLHLAALADGRLPRLLTTSVPCFAAQVNAADASGGTPLEAAASGYRRAEGLLHLVQCGAQVYDDSGAILAAALPLRTPAHDRCVLLDAFGAAGALVLLEQAGIGAASVSARTAPPSEASVMPGLPWREVLKCDMGALLLHRLVSWAPDSLGAWTDSTWRAHDQLSQWEVTPAFYVFDEYSSSYEHRRDPERTMWEVVRSGLASAYARRRESAPPSESLPAILWTRYAARHLRPMLMRDTAWARRSPLVALRHMLRAQHELALGAAGVEVAIAYLQ